MQRSERWEAQRDEKITYFTGRPCKHGHITYRYTLSGSCVKCVMESNSKIPDPRRPERREAKRSLVFTKIRAAHVDRDALNATALAFAVMRHPSLRMADVVSGAKPAFCASGTGLYAYRMPPEDVDAFRALALQMFKARFEGKVDIAEARRRAMGIAQSFPRA